MDRGRLLRYSTAATREVRWISGAVCGRQVQGQGSKGWAKKRCQRREIGGCIYPATLAQTHPASHPHIPATQTQT